MKVKFEVKTDTAVSGIGFFPAGTHTIDVDKQQKQALIAAGVKVVGGDHATK